MATNKVACFPASGREPQSEPRIKADPISIENLALDAIATDAGDVGLDTLSAVQTDLSVLYAALTNHAMVPNSDTVSSFVARVIHRIDLAQALSKNSATATDEESRDATARSEPESDSRVKAAAPVIIQLTDRSLCDDGSPDVGAIIVVDGQRVELHGQQARELAVDLREVES